MRDMIRCTMLLKGTRGLLMHNERLVDALDPYTKALKALSSKRKKTEEDLLAMRRIEWEGGLYWSATDGPYVPGANVKKCFAGGAKIHKSGLAVLRGVHPSQAEIPLGYDGPRDIGGLWEATTFCDVRAVGIGQQKVMRARPRFREWWLDVSLGVLPSLVTPEDLLVWAQLAGQIEGLGDYRPTFGQFTIHNFTELPWEES